MKNIFIYPNLPEALLSIRPGAMWTLNGVTYEGLTWLDEKQTKPTAEEVEQELNRLISIYNDNQYQRDRADAYPSIEDQLDTLYHQGYDGWKASISAIKNKFPK
jgi:hypothetical protein